MVQEPQLLQGLPWGLASVQFDSVLHLQMDQAVSQFWVEWVEVNHLVKNSSDAHPFRLVYFWITPKNT